jgi:hypothetical protein
MRVTDSPHCRLHQPSLFDFAPPGVFPLFDVLKEADSPTATLDLAA